PASSCSARTDLLLCSARPFLRREPHWPPRSGRTTVAAALAALASTQWVHPRIRRPHLLRLLPGTLNLHQLALPDPPTPLHRFPPLPLVIHHLRPKRKNPALHRLHRMNRAAAFSQKMTLRFARNAQPQ